MILGHVWHAQNQLAVRPYGSFIFLINIIIDEYSNFSIKMKTCALGFEPWSLTWNIQPYLNKFRININNKNMRRKYQSSRRLSRKKSTISMSCVPYVWAVQTHKATNQAKFSVQMRSVLYTISFVISKRDQRYDVG